MATNEPSDVFKFYNMRGPDECWEYIGNAWGGRAREPRPYFMAMGRRQIAYRWVFELVNGVTLTSDQLILHSCDQGGAPVGCGNPKHMRLGTTAENMNDMKVRERHGLPATVVRAIRRLIEQGQTQDEIARLYGLTREVVSSIATHRVYQHVE
jgi:predicted XRE-type DNA-binding protein